MRSTRKTLVLIALLAVCAKAARADTAAEVYRAVGLDPAKVLTGTTLNAKVVPGAAKQVVALTTYFTGKEEKQDAVNVRLDVFDRRGGKLVPVFTRDIGEARGGYVAFGDLELVDLDLDGVNEIIVSYDSFADALIEQRIGEVILYDKQQGFDIAWSEPLEYDATRAARHVPVERRDRFERELDLKATLRTRGVTLYVRKTVLAVAGERLPEPQTVEETFPLRTP